VIEALAAILVGMALVWLVIQPLVLPGVAGPALPDLPDPEETPRGQALLALKEIEFDRATGKLSESDYESLYARYSARAIAALDAPAGNDDRLESLIAARRSVAPAAAAAEPGAAPAVAPADPAGRHCLVHGEPGEADAQFCPACGAGLVAADGRCAACGTDVPDDARFCPGCGVTVRS